MLVVISYISLAGSPIGYCSLELSEKGTYGVKKIKSDFACLSSFPLRSETLYPPERDQVNSEPVEVHSIFF